MMDAAYTKARTILTEHMDKLEAIAQVLLEKETIEAEEFYALMKDASPDDPGTGSTPSTPEGNSPTDASLESAPLNPNWQFSFSFLRE